MKYEPTRESVDQHPVPQWFNDAKFGIFIHWGLYSVPGWAYSEKGKSIRDIHEETDEFTGQTYNPYAEWYQNTLRIEGSPTQAFHAETYGKDFPYSGFQEIFEKESQKMDPKAWAELFRKAGAKYVVMVTKHHDGYCLWPSENKNPKQPEYQSKRDLVGELTDAVRAEGMKMGLYYSGILDWTFKKGPMNSAMRWVDHYIASDEYAAYSLAQTEELIHRYHPAVLWNDMGYPAQCDLNALFADYYNTVPEGVISERWTQRSLDGRTLEEYVSELEKKGEVTRIEGESRGDYTCPEYVDITSVPAKKWESCRGIGMSFGYNRNEDPANFMTGKDVIWSLADMVSKNGNLLLNVGPCADGTIQEEQIRPLLETGEWLAVNGDAIYGTTYWTEKQEDVTAEGKKVCYTRKGDVLNAIVLDDAHGKEVTIPGLQIPADAKVTVYGTAGTPEYHMENGGLTVCLPEEMGKTSAYTIRIEGFFKD